MTSGRNRRDRRHRPGSDPGLSDIICRAVADRLDRVDRINLYWGATKIGPKARARSALQHLYCFGGIRQFQPAVSRWQLQEVPAQAGAETIDLPAALGTHDLHPLPAFRAADRTFFRGHRRERNSEFTWKLSLPARDHEAWVGLVKAGFGAADEPVTVKGVSVRPLDVLQAVIDRNIAKNRQPYSH